MQEYPKALYKSRELDGFHIVADREEEDAAIANGLMTVESLFNSAPTESQPTDPPEPPPVITEVRDAELEPPSGKKKKTK